MRDRSMHLDAFDIKILAALQREGRMKKVELAAEIGLTPSPCWERLKRLEEAGFIRGYRAEVDLDRILRHENVFVTVTLGSHEAANFRRFESAIGEVPEILECFAVGGGVDYILQVVVPDVGQYQTLMERLLSADIGIHQYFTYVVTKAVKRGHGYPIAHLMAQAEQARAAD